jgi:hypothetical protein
MWCCSTEILGEGEQLNGQVEDVALVADELGDLAVDVSRELIGVCV